ncbi:hypothetical protein HGA88_04585 [Candidatus Roizmanbacteria bacterium]|nr:hypothetical protein [Candidatus Roizmanbacteria bacterium]
MSEKEVQRSMSRRKFLKMGSTVIVAESADQVFINELRTPLGCPNLMDPGSESGMTDKVGFTPLEKILKQVQDDTQEMVNMVEPFRMTSLAV